MKKLLFLCCLIAFNFSLIAQQNYTVNNENLVLKTEIEGTIDLLWNTINGEYRYFLKEANNSITELKNEKDNTNKYLNQYQQTLKKLTGNDASKVKLTLYSLKKFINDYNASQDANYTFSDGKAVLKSRIGVFGGITNNRFITNPDNAIAPNFTGEFEVFGVKSMTKHAGFASVRHTLSTAKLDYTATQIALGYRYRFINKDCFNIYGQTKFVTYTFSQSKEMVPSELDPNTLIEIEASGTAFDAPFIFGLGADFKIGNGYVSAIYDSLFALLIDNKEHFPVDFSIGYKFNL